MVNKDIELLKEGIDQGFEDFKVEIVEESYLATKIVDKRIQK